MQNNSLAKTIDLETADNPHLQRLRAMNWIVQLKNSDIMNDDTLQMDMVREQFLVKKEIFQHYLAEHRQNKKATENVDEKSSVIALLLSYLENNFPDVPPSQIHKDVDFLREKWNQQIPSMVPIAINVALDNMPETSHLKMKCDYTTNLTYENGRLILEVNYFNFKVVNGDNLENKSILGDATARWELKNGDLQLQNIQCSNPTLSALITHGVVPSGLLHAFNDPKLKSNDAKYLKSKQVAIEKLWHINSSNGNLDGLPKGVRTIYEKCLEAQSPNANVPQLAGEVRKIWTEQWKKREMHKHSLLGKTAETLDTYTKHRDKNTEKFYSNPNPFKKSN